MVSEKRRSNTESRGLNTITAYILPVINLSAILLILLTPLPGYSWEIGGLFKNVDCIISTPSGDYIFVSSINGSPRAKNSKGYISKVASDGSSVNLKFIDGSEYGYTLHAPKGMAIRDSVLYVTDIDFVRGFHVEQGINVANINLAPYGAKGLNDIAVDKEGNLLVTDTLTGRIFKIDRETEEITIFLHSPMIQTPYGISVLPTGAILVSSYIDRTIWLLDNKKLTKLWEDKNGLMNAYGIDYDRQGNIYFSDFTYDKIYILNWKGEITPLQDNFNQPVKICLDRKNNILFVPEYGAHRVKAIKLK